MAELLLWRHGGHTLVPATRRRQSSTRCNKHDSNLKFRVSGINTVPCPRTELAARHTRLRDCTQHTAHRPCVDREGSVCSFSLRALPVCRVLELGREGVPNVVQVVQAAQHPPCRGRLWPRDRNVRTTRPNLCALLRPQTRQRARACHSRVVRCKVQHADGSRSAV